MYINTSRILIRRDNKAIREGREGDQVEVVGLTV